MKKLILRLKNRIRKWLGLGEMLMGIDLGIKDQTVIIIASRLKGGQITIVK